MSVLLASCAADAGLQHTDRAVRRLADKCTPCAESDDDPSMKKCDFWGDAHYPYSFLGRQFTFNKLGVYDVASACDGSFKLQSFFCPFNGGYGTVAIGVAMQIDGKKVMLIDGKGSVDGVQVGVNKPPGLAYAGSLTANSNGVQVVSQSGCVRVNVDRRRPSRALKPGWLHNVKLRVAGRAIDQNATVCNSDSSSVLRAVTNDDSGMLFSFEELTELCVLCQGNTGNGENSPNCYGVAMRKLQDGATARSMVDKSAGSSAHEAAQAGRTAEQACTDQNARYTDAQAACNSLAADAFSYQSCLMDYCNSGGDQSIVANDLAEARRLPAAAAACTSVDGSSLSAFYPCRCSAQICSSLQICDSGTCKSNYNTCSDVSGTRLSTIYPCLCANVICASGEVCAADGRGDGLCETATSASGNTAGNAAANNLQGAPGTGSSSTATSADGNTAGNAAASPQGAQGAGSAAGAAQAQALRDAAARTATAQAAAAAAQAAAQAAQAAQAARAQAAAAAQAKADAEAKAKAAAAATARAAGQGQPHVDIPVENIDCSALKANPALEEQVKAQAIRHFIEAHGISQGKIRAEVVCGSIIVKLYVDPSVPASSYSPTVSQDAANGYPQLRGALLGIPGITGVATGSIFIKAQCSPSVCAGGLERAPGTLKVCAGATCTRVECCQEEPTAVMGPVTGSSPASMEQAKALAMQSAGITDIVGMWMSTPRKALRSVASKAGSTVLTLAGLCLAVLGATAALVGCRVWSSSRADSFEPLVRALELPLQSE